jgi:hypothetical protein
MRKIITAVLLAGVTVGTGIATAGSASAATHRPASYKVTSVHQASSLKASLKGSRTPACLKLTSSLKGLSLGAVSPAASLKGSLKGVSLGSARPDGLSLGAVSTKGLSLGAARTKQVTPAFWEWAGPGSR